jgi:hypothetical protein
VLKKRCQVCGAMNEKESLNCLECGRPLSVERIEPPPILNSVGPPPPEVKPEINNSQEEYYNPEKILFKTGGQAGLEPEYLQEAVILIIEGYLIIQFDKALKIPLSQIKDVNPNLDFQSHTFIGHLNYDLTITFIDQQNTQRKIYINVSNSRNFDLRMTIYRQIIGKYFKTVSPRSVSTSDNFSFRIEESFRDKIRDLFYAGLKSIGINATMAERGRFEEDIRDIEIDLSGYSLGIIGIEEGPIRWINIRKDGSMQDQGFLVYFIDYGVIDTKLKPSSDYQTYYFDNSRWQRNDSDSEIKEHLNNDPSLKEAFLQGVRISAFNDYGCWIISKKQTIINYSPIAHCVESLNEFFSPDRKATGCDFVPSAAEWKCYNTIAKHLL